MATPILLKYVRIPGDKIIIFSRDILHSTFFNLKPLSAGYCEVMASQLKVDCFGKSETLGLEADREVDSIIASAQVFG